MFYCNFKYNEIFLQNMKKKYDNLDKAIDALKSQPSPPGPPKELIDTTLEKLKQAGGTETTPTVIPVWKKITSFKNISKIAAAAALVAAALLLIPNLTKKQTLPQDRQFARDVKDDFRSTVTPTTKSEAPAIGIMAAEHGFITPDARVGRSAIGIFINKILYDRIFELSAAIYQVVFNATFVS